MSSRVLGFAVFFACSALLAQNQPGATPVVYHWTTGATGSEATDVQGSHILMEKSTSGEVAVSIREVGQYVRAYVQLLNYEKDPVHFDPMKANLVVVTPKEKTFTALEPETASRGIKGSAESDQNDVSGAGCALMTAGCQPIDSAMKTSKDVATIGAQEAALALKDGMKPLVVNQNDQAQGSIYFKPDRKRKDVVIRIPFGDGIYEFPFTLGKK